MRTLWLMLFAALAGSACVGITCAWDDLSRSLGPSPPGGQYAPPVVDWSPRWSPDGQHVVATISRSSYEPGVYIASANGSDLRRVYVDPDGDQAFPSISHDGRVAYEEYAYIPRQGIVRADSSPHHRRIGIASLEGEAKSQVPLPTGWDVTAWMPVWVPGTDRILVVAEYRDDYTKDGIHEIDADGHLRRLDITEGRFIWWEGFWVSPDGEHVAYFEERERVLTAVISRLDGIGNPVRASSASSSREFSNIAWSRDGQRIFFATWKQQGHESRCLDTDSRAKIWSMRADGSGTELVADIRAGVALWAIAPSPDEKMFALAAQHCGVSGSSAFKLWYDGQLQDLIPRCCRTRTHPRTAGLSWSPDGTRIAVLDNNTAYPGGVLRTVNPDGSDVRVLVYRGTDGALMSGQP